MNKTLLILITTAFTHACHGAVTVTAITELQFDNHTTENLSWVAGAQAGNLSENEVGVKATSNYASFSYTEEYYDSTHTGWDISSAQTTFPPVALTSETPFSLSYDGSTLTFGLGPTVGRTSYTLSLPVAVVENFNHIGMAVYSEGVQNDTHIRMRDMAFNGQSIATLDAWGGTGAFGSNPFDGVSLLGVSDTAAWTLIGTIEFDYQGGLGNGFPEDDDFQFRIIGNQTVVPEPSAAILVMIGSVIGFFRRSR